MPSIGLIFGLTKNQQAQQLMKQGQFKAAEAKFERPDWRAAAAYRAGEYQEAAKQFQDLQSETGFYNQGNALAKSGKYKQAIEAYNKALAINPKNKDALFNRKLVKDLLRKNKNQQNKDQNNKISRKRMKISKTKLRINRIRISKARINKIRINKIRINKIKINRTKINKSKINKITINKIRIIKISKIKIKKINLSRIKKRKVRINKIRKSKIKKIRSNLIQTKTNKKARTW